ncbi:trace amine-associated receptor 13c-like protein [Labeo rohita]|uniref:Trace amine-associated receptor 13c-like protein n=1 Tax=Labeo rohita TaxID=84645 RepID=A0A498P5A8_LABRO|nr:trace amine-associated receptor 13c-like protein [Labeo rohita]
MAYETEDYEIQYCFPAINSSCIKGKRSRFTFDQSLLITVKPVGTDMTGTALCETTYAPNSQVLHYKELNS